MDKVLDQLDHHFIRLMRNWAKATSGSSNAYSMTSAYTGVMAGDGYDSAMPILQGEAMDVDVAFQAVDMPERIAVQLYWLYETRSLRWLAAKARCSHPTYAKRCIDGHVALKQEMARRRAKLGQIGNILKTT